MLYSLICLRLRRRPISHSCWSFPGEKNTSVQEEQKSYLSSLCCFLSGKNHLLPKGLRRTNDQQRINEKRESLVAFRFVPQEKGPPLLHAHGLHGRDDGPSGRLGLSRHLPGGGRQRGGAGEPLPRVVRPALHQPRGGAGGTGRGAGHRRAGCALRAAGRAGCARLQARKKSRLRKCLMGFFSEGSWFSNVLWSRTRKGRSLMTGFSVFSCMFPIFWWLRVMFW